MLACWHRIVKQCWQHPCLFSQTLSETLPHNRFESSISANYQLITNNYNLTNSHVRSPYDSQTYLSYDCVKQTLILVPSWLVTNTCYIAPLVDFLYFLLFLQLLSNRVLKTRQQKVDHLLPSTCLTFTIVLAALRTRPCLAAIPTICRK